MRMRRRLLTGLLALALPVLSLAPQSAPAQIQGGAKTIVGAWIVNVMPDPPGSPQFTNVTTINADGTSTNTDPGVGGGHGVWKKTGPQTYATMFLTLTPPSPGLPFPAGTWIKVTGTLTLQPGGNELTGPFLTVFSTLPDGGAELGRIEGNVVLQRIGFGN